MKDNRDERQKLVDLAFQLAIVAANNFNGKSNEDIADWVRDQLKQCGFPTTQIGSSWGVLS